MEIKNLAKRNSVPVFGIAQFHPSYLVDSPLGAVLYLPENSGKNFSRTFVAGKPIYLLTDSQFQMPFASDEIERFPEIKIPFTIEKVFPESGGFSTENSRWISPQFKLGLHPNISEELKAKGLNALYGMRPEHFDRFFYA